MKTNNFEWNRQLFHIFFGIAIVVLLTYGIIGRDISHFKISNPYIPHFKIADAYISKFKIVNADILIFIIFGLLLSYICRKIKIPIIFQLLEKFERKEEIKKFPGKGMIFYFIGVYTALLLFPKDIAMASILVLALGDSVSHLYGLHFGKIRHPFSKTKFIEGTVAGFAFGFVGAFVFLPWWEALPASLAAMTAESIEIKIGTEQVDDNLIIPVVAGAAVWIVRYL